MGTPNWGKLVATGRAKSFGISWTEEEATAVFVDNIPADYVRDGFLTKEDYAQECRREAKVGVKLSHKSEKELLKIAEEVGLKVSPQATKEALVNSIEAACESKEKEAESTEAVILEEEGAEKEAPKDSEEEVEANLEDMLKEDLQKEAEKKGLDSSGTKAELIEKLNN